MSMPRRARLGQAADAVDVGEARATDFVQSLQRGLAVIRAFDADASGLTTSDVARSVGFTRAAARRFLLTLAELGYVRVDGRVFRLTPRVLELGRGYLASLTLPELARPHLAGFVESVRESSSLAVLDGGDIVYIGQVAARRVLSVSVTVGGRDPAFATSLGRVLLAARSEEWLDAYVEGLELRPITTWTIVDRAVLREELRRVGRQGWSLVDQELEEGLRALAVPIRDEGGRVVAAANVALHASRWSVESIRGSLLPQLRAAVAAIERDIRDAPSQPAATPPRRQAPAAEIGPDQEVPKQARATDFVQSLQRGLAVIRAFDADASGLTTSDVARSVGFTRAAARRFLLTLAELGYVRVDGRVFRLTPRVLELGRGYLASLTLPELARPHLAGFVESVRESSSLAVLDGGDIVYIGQVAARRVLSVSVTVGGRDPAFATSLGRVLLAARSEEWLDAYVEGLELRPITTWTIVDRAVLREELRRVGRQGWSLVDQELEEGLRALAVPIRDEGGRVVAAANVALHASRWSVESIRGSLLPQLRAAVAAIERDIRASGVSSYNLRAIAELHGG